MCQLLGLALHCRNYIHQYAIKPSQFFFAVSNTEGALAFLLVLIVGVPLVFYLTRPVQVDEIEAAAVEVKPIYFINSYIQWDSLIRLRGGHPD